MQDLKQWGKKMFAIKYKKIVVKKLSTNFREATEIVQVQSVFDIKEDEVVIKVKYCGINASDVNYTAGKYLEGVNPPFDAGFEAVGTILKKGSKVNLNLGQPVVFARFGSFAEYIVVPAKIVIPIPEEKREFLPLLTSGLTASISLSEIGEIKKGQTILITAAAGATGLFAVILSKLKGLHVIGTCSTEEKIELLKKLGCDRVINYKKEDLNTVLKNEYKNGVDVVYESVGGKFFDISVQNIAKKGKIIVIGMISGYVSGEAWNNSSGPSYNLSSELLKKSASVRGFFLLHYSHLFQQHMLSLTQLLNEGKLGDVVDEKEFFGLESVATAIDYLFNGLNKGKVIVTLGKKSNL
eukprot:TRINITY_DN3085_c0_g1_i1.p1 TRINITY_DN3085_c0_g1~~TRINITY_DN3085_c0_g1_i1.p1  ORF type:complete len:353 (+),score=109.25 TRINITY_DN3085_c0_g1_i1:2-1060(+)